MSISHTDLVKGIQPRINRKQRRRIAKEIRSQRKAASYARYSSELQNQVTNDDQHRWNEGDADSREHSIGVERRYSDLAVSGTKVERDGLDQLLADAEAGKFSTIYFFSLSRLARESLIGMSIMKKLVNKLGIRVISVSEGLDTDRNGWEMQASMLFMFHQKFIEQLAADVFRSQEGVVLGNQSVGDHRFGYTSTPISGAPPRGRGKKPPKEYGIHEQQAWWVVAIFRWFVEKKLSITRIVKLLNNRKVHKGHRAKRKCEWSHSNVISILESTKYIGLWPWGLLKNHRDPETGRVWQEPRDEKEVSDDWMRFRPDLMIVDVDLYKAAQERLDKNRKENAKHRTEKGKFKSNRGSHGNPPRHLLSNLLFCSCGHRLYIGGSGGKYLYCPRYKRGTCKCKTNIRKDLATRLILEIVTSAVCNDDVWLEETFRSTESAWKKNTKSIPGEIKSLERSLANVDRKIEHLLDRIENGNDEISVEKRLTQRQNERQGILSDIADLSRRQVKKTDPPTKAWVKRELQNLVKTVSATNPAVIEAIHDLVGGRIPLEEVRPQKGRPYLRGKMTLRVSDATKLLLGKSVAESVIDDKGDIVVYIDFKDPDPMIAFTKLSDQAKALYDEDLMNAEIAKSLGVSRSMVTKLLHHWFDSRGLVMPDGRSRRAKLARKHMEQPYYRQVSDRVKQLMDQGLLLGQIAEVIGCDRNTVTSAARFWYESRGLEYLDGRARRKSLDRKVSG
jgi:predicted site-specific integrase-resolvase/predicted transcriptional regulator